MLLKKPLQIVMLGVGILALAACSSTGTGANATGGGLDAAAGTDASGGDIQTAGLGSSSDNGLSNPNAMVPGADQKYYFDFDKNDVHASDMPSIKLQGQYLVSHPSASVLLEGNTDIRGSREYNIALGQRRANAIQSILKLQGIPASQMRTISYGAEKPAALGNSETDYAKNRRAELVYQSH